jgi:hypothetical protein
LAEIGAPSTTGTGASGTWGINITGNAATATSAGTADNIDNRAYLNIDSGNAISQDSYQYNGGGYVNGVSLFGQSDGAMHSATYSTAWVHQIYGDFRTGQIAIRGKNNGTWQAWRTVLDSGNYNSYSPTLTGGNASGTWGISITGNAGTSTSFSTGQSNYKGVTDGSVAGLMMWKHYGNSHVIFDASNSTTPSGTSCNNTNSGIAWTGSYPTLMGWNGSNTYGVRVDSARVSDNTSGNSATTSQRTFSGNLIGSSSVRGPIFYDTNNTAYYVDPASTSTSVQVAGAIEQGNNYSHPNVEWSASSGSTGMVIFYLPGTTSNYGMIHMVFDLYEYTTGRTATVIVGGHNWSTAWYNNGCQVIGETNKGVRLGVKNGRFCVIFGNVGSSWNYGTVRLRKIHNASFYDNVMDLGGNWSAELTNTESFSYVTGDLRQLRTSNTFTADGDIRSPIFYDSNNTGYYVDPASTSVLNTTRMTGALLVGNGGAGHQFLEVLNATSAGGIKVGGLLCSDSYNFGTPSRNDILAKGNITAYSDGRYKTNIEVIPNAVEKVKQIRGVTYDMTDDSENRRYAGVIAQEVKKVLPEVVMGSEEDRYSVAYGNMVGLLIEAIKEQQTQIEELTSQINTLKEMIK